MNVTVVRIGKVGMRVPQRLMSMGMPVFSLSTKNPEVVVPMMVIMFMFVRVLQNFMGVFMDVLFHQMQPDTDSHKRSGT